MGNSEPYKSNKFDLFENNKPLRVGIIIGIVLLAISISHSVYKQKLAANMLVTTGIQTDAQIIGVWKLKKSESKVIYMFGVNNDIYTGSFNTTINIQLNQKIIILYEPTNPSNNYPLLNVR